MTDAALSILASGKITVELEYHVNEDGTHVVFTHPDLEHTMTLPFSSPRLMQVQLDALNVVKVTNPVRDLSLAIPEMIDAFFGGQTR